MFSRYKKPKHLIALELFSSLAQLFFLYTDTAQVCISQFLSLEPSPSTKAVFAFLVGARLRGLGQMESSNCHLQCSCLKNHSSVLPTELKRPTTCFETKIWSCCGCKSNKDGVLSILGDLTPFNKQTYVDGWVGNLIHCTCWFLKFQYSHYRQFEPTNTRSLKTELGRGDRDPLRPEYQFQRIIYGESWVM